MTKTMDANRKVKFRITRRDIDRAKRKDPFGCAAALALRRRLGADVVEVHATRTYVEIGGRRTRFKTPENLNRETIVLDRQGKFEAGDYVLQPIPPSQTIGALAARNKMKKRGGQKRSKTRAAPRPTPNVRATARGGR